MADTLESAPRLRDESGGRDVVLEGRILTFGSAGDCGLPLSGKGLPARMGHLLFRGGAYELHSAVAGDAVRVNGRPVAGPVVLKHGDRVSLAGRGFRFETGDSRQADPSAPESGPLEGIIGALVGLLRDRDPDPFASLVAAVSRLLRCDAARVVEESPGTGERRTLARFPRHSGLERFSNKAIDWARESEGSVLAQAGDWGEAESQGSLSRNAVASVLCVALREEGAVAGYLYLDRTRESPPFAPGDKALCDSLRPLFEIILARRRESERQRETIARLQSSALEGGGGLVFSGKAMERAVDLARRAARTGAPVLIQGETGTGKELLARFIHSQSSRSSGPFVAVNCGAIPENLVESELFGHEKGAFTGADRRKPGLFETARGGTLFLDEIGDLPSAIQVKLLRVLQESEIRRVGGEGTLAVDVRILAATHRDLAGEVREGRFRQDLYFRLSVVGVTLPPLRERGEDILLLAEYLLKRFVLQYGLEARGFSRAGLARLMRHPFPGNVRELENAIQKALIMSDGPELDMDDLAEEPGRADADSAAVPAPAAAAAAPHAVSASTATGSASDAASSTPAPSCAGDPPATLRAVRLAAEGRAIAEALARTQGNVSAAAKSLDVDRKWLMKLMEEHGLEADAFRRAGDAARGAP